MANVNGVSNIGSTQAAMNASNDPDQFLTQEQLSELQRLAEAFKNNQQIAKVDKLLDEHPEFFKALRQIR